MHLTNWINGSTLIQRPVPLLRSQNVGMPLWRITTVSGECGGRATLVFDINASAQHQTRNTGTQSRRDIVSAWKASAKSMRTKRQQRSGASPAGQGNGHIMMTGGGVIRMLSRTRRRNPATTQANQPVLDRPVSTSGIYQRRYSPNAFLFRRSRSIFRVWKFFSACPIYPFSAAFRD